MATPVVYPAPKLWQRVLRWLTTLLNAGASAGWYSRSGTVKAGVVPVGRVNEFFVPPPVVSVSTAVGDVPYTRIPQYSRAVTILKGVKTALLTLAAIVAPMVLDALLQALSNTGTVATILKTSFGDNAAIILLTPVINGIATSYWNRRKQLKIKEEVHG
jgi:hypothetical protein